ncbi:uncharacterized protein LOC119161406 isoform X2 [Rhipicephalus microplus]|uniref:uncharacterized protein LOC119161406 isoform X2 n=1 Tax=Rhipicephalus microplus TaxID=6941 RepID=UPI003F6B2FD1
MSTVSGLPSKGEKGKPKYLALDINNIYKGKSLENPKTSAAPKHGLQSLGKVGAGRRMPPPVNLPSLKSENSGNNPNISLVPSGGQGWGSAGKEKGKSPEENSSGPQQQSQHSQSPTSHSQGPPASKQPQQPQPQLQPPQQQQPPPQQQQAPVATSTSAPGGPGSGVTVGGGVGSSAGVKTWSSVTSSQEGGGPERNFLGHQSPFFPQEFPKLAGGDVPIDGTQRSATDSQYGPGPSLRPQMEGTWSRGTLQQQPPPQQQQQQQQQQVPGGGSGGGGGGQGCGPPGGLPPSSGSGVNGQASFASPPRGALPSGVPPGGGPPSSPAQPSYRQQAVPPFVQVYGRGFPGNYATSFSSVPGTARPPYTYSDSRVRGVRNAPDEDGYQRPAIISEKDLKGFDEILQNDSQDGWAAAKGDIDYNAKLVFSDEEDAGGSSRSAAPKGSDVVQVSESGKPVAMKGSEKGECRPPVPAGPKLPPSRSREPGWDASSGQQSAQQRTGREPPPTQTSAYMDREERGRKTWGAPGSAELQPQPPALSQQSQQAPSAQTAPVRQWPQSPQGAPPPAAAPVAAAPRATGAPPLDYLARGTPPPATTPPALAAAGFTSGRVGPPMPPQQSSHHSGFGGGPVAPSRGSSRQGLDQLTGDEEELWRQRRQQHNDEMAVTVERTRQRREEEEKRYEQIKQSSAATAAAANAAGQQQQQPQQQQPSVPDESTSVPAEKEDLDQRSCHSSESREEVRGGTLLPSRERPDFRQQSLGGYQNYQRPFKNMPPRFLKKAEMQRQQQLRQQQQQQQQPQSQQQQQQQQQPQQPQPQQTSGGLAPPQTPSSLGSMGGVSYDPRWVAMGAGGPYLGQLGMGPLKALGGQRPPEPEGGTSYPSADDRPYESREARPLECWPPGAGRPAPPQADRPAQALAPPMAPPHVSPGGPYDNWRPSVAPVYYGSQVPDFGRAAASYDQRLDFPSKRPDKEETAFESRSRGDSFRKERDFEDKQQREKRENRDTIGAWSSTREYDQRVPRDKWERETRPSRPDSRDSRTSRDSLRDERAMPPADQRQEMPLPQMEPHRIAAERVKDKPQVADWSDTPYSSAPGESKRRDWHTHHPPPVTQQQLDSAGPSKKNFVPLRRGGVAKDDGKDDVKEGKVEDNSRADEDKAKEAAKKDDAEKRMPASRSRGGSGGRFEANRGGRGGRGGNGYSSGNVGYRGRSREYRRSRTERGPRFDRKKDDGSESSGVEEEKPINRLRPKDEESEGSEEACPDSVRKNRTAKEVGRAREPRRDEAKNKEEKSAFSPRGEPSRRGRGGAMALGRSSRGRYQAGGYGPPTLKAPFGKPEDGNKEEEASKDGSTNQVNKPRSNSSRPVVRRPNRMEPLPPRFQKNQPRRQDNPERNKGRGSRGAGPSKDALSDVANEDWETASESSDVADRRGFDEGVRQQSSGSKKGLPTSSKAPGGGQERRRSGGEVRRGGGGAPSDRNGRGVVQRRDSGGGGPPARMGRGGGSRPGGRSRQQQQQRPGDVKGEPSQATMVYRMDEVKLQDPVGVQAALTDMSARKHTKKSEQGQPNGKLEKEKPNALEGIDLSNYAGVVVIDDHLAVTDQSQCDGDDGDFQEVTSKKRHKVLTEGDSKKKKETKSKTSVHGRQNKLPPRLIKKRESDRLFSSKTECQPPPKTDGSATESADTTTVKPQQHCSFSSKELAPSGVLRPVVNAWEKPITHALRGGSPPSSASQSMSAPAVSSADVLVSSKSSSFDRSSDQHDSGIDVSDLPASAASSQRSSPSNDGKAPLLGTSPKGLAAIPVGVPPSAVPPSAGGAFGRYTSSTAACAGARKPSGWTTLRHRSTRDHAYIKAVGVDSSKPMGTVIFENKNFKAENAALDKFESQTKSQEPGCSNAPMLPPVASKAPNDTVEPSKCKGEDTVDMKLDFTFDSELAQFSDEKQAKHIAITRSLSSEITSANSPISPSTDDLNLKIASVKKVWESMGPLPTVLEHSAVSVAGDDTGSAAVQAQSFGSFGGSASSDTSFGTSSTATESMAQQGQTEPTQAPSEAAFGSVSPLKPATASPLSHHVASVVGAGHHTSTSGHPHHPHHNHHLQQQPQVQPQQHLSLAVHHHHSQAHGSLQTPQQQQQQQAMMRQTHQAHTMLDQQNLSKVRALHALSPPPTAAASSLAGLDVRAMANLQVAGMQQAVASPPAALLFTSTQQMTQPAALYQTLLQDPVPRPVAHQFSQATHGYPAPPYQSFNQGGMFVPPPPTHSGPDMFAATGAALRLQPTYQTGPTSQVLGQQSLPTAPQLLGSGRAAPGGAPLGTSYYPSQGGYYPSQQQNQALAFGSQPPLHRTFHPPPFKSLELATDFGATLQPKTQANKAFPPGSPFAFGQGRQSAPSGVATTGATPKGSSLRPPPMHVLPLHANLVRGTPPTAPTKYPAPIQRPQQGLTLTSTQQARGQPAAALRAQQPPARQLPTSDQQAKQQAEAVKQAQLFFAQSKPMAPEPTTEDVVNESSDDKAPKEAAEE